MKSGLYAGVMIENSIARCPHGNYAECVTCEQIKDDEKDDKDDEEG